MAFSLPFLKKKSSPERLFETAALTSKDIIAPASVKVESAYLDIGGRDRNVIVLSDHSVADTR